MPPSTQPASSRGFGAETAPQSHALQCTDSLSNKRLHPRRLTPRHLGEDPTRENFSRRDLILVDPEQQAYLGKDSVRKKPRCFGQNRPRIALLLSGRCQENTGVVPMQLSKSSDSLELLSLAAEITLFPLCTFPTSCTLLIRYRYGTCTCAN